jgi:hypothetical protein
LDTWWNHSSFVQFGSTKSGDNFALKHIIDHLSPEEMQAHVRIAKMQCLFNSYPWNWMAMWKSLHALIFHTSTTWKGLLIFLLTLHYICATSISFKSERATQLILKTGLSKCYLDISLSTMLILSAHNASFALEKLNLADTN